MSQTVSDGNKAKQQSVETWAVVGPVVDVCAASHRVAHLVQATSISNSVNCTCIFEYLFINALAEVFINAEVCYFSVSNNYNHVYRVVIHT